MVKLSNRTILVLIMVVSAFLRFFNYAEIPFTHDEFSALSRLHYNDFSTLITEGVMEDGHPAGIQVFLYYWVRLFGSHEWIVKLPFTIFGLLSVWLVFKIASRWFNETTGLLTAAFIASIQFTVMYSQIARPYISGLFFSLLMVYYWSKMMLSPEKNFLRNSLLFVLSASLCTYNHHFSLLFAFIVGVSGLVMIERKYRLPYILSGLAIMLLYIPHLKIFFYQLHAGGVEDWLAKPHLDFFITFPAYLFNFSILSLLITLAIVLYGVSRNNRLDINYKHYLLFFSWFMIPLLTGFLYSIRVSAVLQFSVLIFSFPYLVFLLFGHIKAQEAPMNLLLVVAILVVNTSSLIFTRDHYTLFYQSPYEALLTDYEEASMAGHTTAIMDSHHRNTAYYSTKLNIDTMGINWFDSFTDENELKCFLEGQSKVKPELFLGALSSVSPAAVPLILDYYPCIEWQRDYAGATSYLFSQKKKPLVREIGKLDFESRNTEQWSSLDPERINDTAAYAGSFAYHMEGEVEFGPTFTANMKEIEWGKNDFIEISARVKCADNTGGQFLVASLEYRGKNIYWGSTSFDKFASCSQLDDEWITVHHVLKMSDIYFKSPNLQLKVYPWNRGGGDFFLDDLQISIRPGNSVIYGLFENF